MNGMKSRQMGSSILTWLVGVFIMGMLLSLAMKIAPLYLDDHGVSKVISSLDDHRGSGSASATMLKSWIDKGLSSKLLKLNDDEIKLSTEYGKMVVNINYERRIKYFYNIDLILTFAHSWKAGAK